MAADLDASMDPKESPARPGVRRVNNVPLAILGGAVAIFLGIMAYVAAGRAEVAASVESHEGVRSARPMAEAIVRDAEAGVVPPADLAPPSSSGGLGAGSATGMTSDGIPVLAPADPNGLPPMPPPPPGLALDRDDALMPPQSAQVLERGGSPSAGGSQDSDESAQDLERMKLEMFKQAVRSSSVAPEGSMDASRMSDPRIAAAHGQRDALQAQMAGGGFMEKLRGLQEAGLLPSGQGGDAKKDSAGNAYARFAGGEGADRWKLGSQQQIPESRYQLRAGAVLPATLQTGINSELPGQITAIVAQDVRDTATGTYVLIPQGSRLVGSYGADVQYGQERVLVAWQRITWPDGKVLDIGAMPGADGAGYAGFHDLVDNHFWRLFGSALLLSGITGGVAYSQDALAPRGDRTTVGSAMGQAVGQQLGQVSEEMIRKQMNVAPTLEIRPGYRFNVQVTQDLTFNGPYRAFDYDRSIAAAGSVYASAR